MNCSSCGAPMHLLPDADSFRCPYCRSVYVPQKSEDGVRVLGDANGEVCPICTTALVSASIAGTRILYCQSCGGMAIPMEIFPGLIDALRSAGGVAVQATAGASDLDRKVSCPRCRNTMETHRYFGPGNVVLDSCSTCSLNWLDRGELMRIARSPDSTYVPTFGSFDSGNTGLSGVGGLVVGEAVAEVAVDILGSIFNSNSNDW